MLQPRQAEGNKKASIQPTSGSTMFCRSARQISWILWMKALGVILACNAGGWSSRVDKAVAKCYCQSDIACTVLWRCLPHPPCLGTASCLRACPAARISQPAQRHWLPQPPTCLGRASWPAMALASMCLDGARRGESEDQRLLTSCAAGQSSARYSKQSELARQAHCVHRASSTSIDTQHSVQLLLTGRRAAWRARSWSATRAGCRG